MEPINPSNENSVGPVIAIIIILAMIILGGLYFWNERSNQPATSNEALSGSLEEMTASIEKQSSSDETSSIEADLNNTNVDNLDSELQKL